MKKIIVVVLISTILLVVTLLVTALIVGFTVVKPTTDTINRALVKEHFSKIVRIPEDIPRPVPSFHEPHYYWEMETLQGEITGVYFKFMPAYSKEESKMTASLSMPQSGDPSLFTKVLPAIIVDKQSLESALDPQKANLNANPQVGYTSLKLAVNPKTSQTILITWEYNKSSLGEDLNTLYANLSKFPPLILTILFTLTQASLELFKG